MVDEKILSLEQKKRKNCMYDFLQYLNKYTHNYILKDGTALMFHYGLNRFSEDIDLDSTDQHTIKNIVEQYCKKNNFQFSHKKNTATTSRFMLSFDNECPPLKIEVSFRNSNIFPSSYKISDGVAVYNIESLASFKILAFAQRDRLRDLFDCAYIINNYYDQLSFPVINSYIESFNRKGIEHFDYIVSQQNDPLIDENVLAESFLSAWDKLGLLQQDERKSPEEIKRIINAELEKEDRGKATTFQKKKKKEKDFGLSL